VEYSFVVPIYNDSYLVKEFLLKMQKTFMSHKFDVIFVNDGSEMESELELNKVAAEFSFAKTIHLSRNFGQHIAVSCGYKFVTGDFITMLNVDLEDSPAEVMKLLERIKVGDCDIVHGLYSSRNVSFLNKMTSAGFGFLLNKLTGFQVPLNASTVRVMTRKFVEKYNSLNEKQRYIPGLEMWLGFRHVYIPIEHQARKKGRSSYNFWKRLRMALSTIYSFSDLPLRIISVGGVGISVIGMAMTTFLIIRKIFGVNLQPGFTSTISAIVFLGGVQIFAIGISGIYIGRILREVQGRPLYVIKSSSLGVDV